MNLYRLILFSLLLCFILPLISNADQLEEANAAIKNEEFKIAHELLIPLVEDNNETAQTLLGALYVNGQGVEKDLTKGLAIIMKAAIQGYEPARIKAFQLCLDLANQGDMAAMYNVGYMCLKGWGGEHDTDVCLRWLENAGKIGHAKSAKILSRIYKKGMFGVVPDKENAIYWSNLTAAFAAGIDGKWEGSISMGGGGQPVNISLLFKTDGDKLTGTAVGYGGKGNPIKDGEIDGKNFSFTVVSKYQGMKITAKYTGIFLEDTLKLTFISDMGTGGASPPITFTAKRAG